MAAEETGIEIVSTPSQDWLPVFQPILYKFRELAAATLQIIPPLTVSIEVSHNNLDFSAPLVAGVVNIPANTAGEYTVNPAPYLQSMFTIGHPVTGIDNSLFKLYRLIASPTVTTNPQRCIYAVENSTIVIEANKVLTLPPTEGYYGSFDGIRTFLMVDDDYIENQVIDAPLIPAHPCPKYPIQLYWLNRFGGWQTWVFNGKHEYEEEVEEGVIWEDASGHTHAASAGPVVTRVSVFSGFISKTEFDMVSTIRHSLKVYHKDGNAWREVLLERGSYQLYKEGDKRREVNFAFTYSEPLFIQSA